jgi:hypothetical protein
MQVKLGLNQWIKLVFNQLVIKEDLGGHPPFSTGSKQFFGNLLFLAVFRVPNFQGLFDDLNDVFS